MAAISSNSLRVGFRFRPRDEELIDHYLLPKNDGEKSPDEVIREIDLCKLEPWDLPDLSLIENDDEQWFFFCSHAQKYPNSRRVNRATQAGYWKTTGADRIIKSRSSKRKIGTKKTLVFYKGRAPNADRTAWVIHEYQTNLEQCTFVLCRLFKKDVKVEDSNCDETELSGAAGSAENPRKKQKMVQSETDMLVGEQSAGIERCLADKSDDITFDALVAEEDHRNTYMASDVEEREAEARATEDDTSIADLLLPFYVPTDGEFKYSNLDEIELIGSTLTAAGSSPKGMLSNQAMVQISSESDMQIQRCLADKSDNITSDYLVLEKDHQNTYMASDVEDREVEVDLQWEEWLSYWSHKPTDGEFKYSNIDEIELIGSTLTAAGSSPTGMPSNQVMVQSNSELYTEIGEQPSGIERFLADKSDNITSKALVPEEDHRNTYMAFSDVEDLEAEVIATEDDLPIEYLCSFFYEPTVGEFGYSNLGEIELIGSTLTAAGSSPKAMPSNQAMVQSTYASDMQMGEQPSGIGRHLTDKSDNITSDALVPEEYHHNTYKASDVPDHETEVELPQGEEEWLSYLNHEPRDGKVQYSNSDEIGLTGSICAAVGSSPEGMPGSHGGVWVTSKF